MYTTPFLYSQADVKPPFSWVQLIVQAISASVNKQLTFGKICWFISNKYPYYRPNDKTWQVIFLRLHGSLEAMKKETHCTLLNLIVQSDKESGRMPTVYVVTNPKCSFFVDKI